MTDKQNKKGNWLFYIMTILLIVFIIYLVTKVPTGNEIQYDEFTQQVVSGEKTVTNVKIVGTTVYIRYDDSKITLKKFTSKNTGDAYFVVSTNAGMEKLEDFIQNYNSGALTGGTIPDTKIIKSYGVVQESIFSMILPYLSIIIFGIIAFIIVRAILEANNKNVAFGKSRAKNVERSKVKFSDVAGSEEEKEELKEIVDFLKNPRKYTELGARIPKGVLLVGPPGTGKTLLARAVAGEAKVPFYYISGSDFVELFVGVGASRVRDMFKQAKLNAPCLIFIDEIDAVGRQRGTGLGGGHDEREQTLNQLLTEMDGFGANEGIIIIAATNRPDVLDPALLRPGRFDRQVTVSLPDKKGREEILKVHAKNKVLGKGITLENLAKRTPGFSGADLENLLNEAALLAVRRNKKNITMSEIDEATDRVLMGPAKVTKKYTEKEKKLVAYHEAGHVVMGLKLDGANDVQKVTIIPRGMAGGYTMMSPKEETFNYTKNELLESICGLLGGRVAEEVTFNEITTGAHDDFKKATKIARSMVTEYGMSSLGPMRLEEGEGNTFLGRDYTKNRNISDTVAHEIDEEMRKIINECYEKAKKIIKENKKTLDLIANALIENETITKEQIDNLVKYGKIEIDEEVKEDIEEKSKGTKSKKEKNQ